MSLPASTVARKLLMTITGQMMILFVIVHVIGNSTIYFNKLNAYAAGLHALPLLVWVFRLFMAAMLGIHVFYGIVLTLENRNAKPAGLCQKRVSECNVRGQVHDMDRINNRRVSRVPSSPFHGAGHISPALRDKAP